MPITGGCRCGALRYELALDSLPLSYACHCLDCQTWSGSAFSLHAMIPDTLLTFHGDVHSFRLADGAETMVSDHVGCASCGTRLGNRNSAVPEMTILRAGTLDRSDEITPAVHIWVKRKQPWLAIVDGTPIFDESPSPQAFADAIAGQ